MTRRATSILEATVADSLRVLGAGHSDTLTSRHNLAYAYQSAGRVDEAIDLFQKVLADCERLMRPGIR